MPRIVFVCQVFRPDSTSTSQLFSSLLSRAAAAGQDVLVLTAMPPDVSPGDVLRNEVDGKIIIRRLGFQVPFRSSMFFRAVGYASFLISVLVALVFERGVGQWIGVTNPPFLSWAMASAASIRRRKFHFFYLDIYPEGLHGLQQLSSGSFVSQIWMRLNAWSMGRMDRIFVLGRDMIPLLSKNYNIPEDRITYFPHWSASESALPPLKRESKFTSLRPHSDRFVVQYSGNMGLWHDIETIVRAAQLLVEDDRIVFHFVASGFRREPAEKLARQLGCSNILWFDPVPLDDLAESLACSDVALISLNEGLSGIAVPCKFYGILASARCVLAQVPSDSEIAQAVREHACGHWVAPKDFTGLARTLQQLASAQSSVGECGRRSFEAYLNLYTVDSAVRRFQSFFAFKQ